jgi:hypothetical protein
MKNLTNLIGSQDSIEKELDAFRAHILHYRRVLNDEGVWTFLATLGCLGVTLGPLRMMAFGVTILIFGQRFSERVGDKRSFSRLTTTIEHRINDLVFEEEVKMTKLDELAALKRQELSPWSAARNSTSFFWSWIFLIFAFAQSGFTLLSN